LKSENESEELEQQEKTELVAEISPGIYSLPDPKNPRKKLLATRNLTPGKVYYGEKTSRVRGESKGEFIEFRFWDPFRSKLSASILKGLKVMPFEEGTICLYLGASTGTTVSHISDIVGDSGRIFAVEMAARVARELLENVARFRKNIIPIIEDARHPERFTSVYGKVDVIYCDIAQPDQTEIAIANCEKFFGNDEGLKKDEEEDSNDKMKKADGILFLVVKASSIDALKDKERVFEEQTKILKRSQMEVLQKIDLEPYDRNHALIVSQFNRK
jgi:fibrillarin-like pre-rRNA processing protein